MIVVQHVHYLIFTGIDDRIQASQWWQNDQASRRISKKLFLLFPMSCMCRDTLTEDDRNISHAGHLDTVVRNRAGTVGRPYRSTVYKIRDRNEVCCVGSENPNILV